MLKRRKIKKLINTMWYKNKKIWKIERICDTMWWKLKENWEIFIGF